MRSEREPAGKLRGRTWSVEGESSVLACVGGGRWCGRAGVFPAPATSTSNKQPGLDLPLSVSRRPALTFPPPRPSFVPTPSDSSARAVFSLQQSIQTIAHRLARILSIPTPFSARLSPTIRTPPWLLLVPLRPPQVRQGSFVGSSSPCADAIVAAAPCLVPASRRPPATASVSCGRA
jgi:hypothetical protein